LRVALVDRVELVPADGRRRAIDEISHRVDGVRLEDADSPSAVGAGHEADLCLSDPGFGVDITIRSDPKTLTAVWVGDLPLGAALSTGAIELEAPDHLVRSFPKWFGLHPLFADVERPASRPRVFA